MDALCTEISALELELTKTARRPNEIEAAHMTAIVEIVDTPFGGDREPVPGPLAMESHGR